MRVRSLWVGGARMRACVVVGASSFFCEGGRGLLVDASAGAGADEGDGVGAVGVGAGAWAQRGGGCFGGRVCFGNPSR